MAFTDSMFLFEIVVEELISYINCSEFDIRGQFADVFSVHLPDPNKIECFLRKQPGKRARKIKSKPKSKTKISKLPEITSMAPTVQSGPTILFAINVETLISNMKQYPLELSLWSKVVPDYRIGSTYIPWSAPYYEYLNKLHRRREQQPIRIVGDYNVFDEITSKRMAVIKLSVKLRHFKDRITKFSSFSTETERTVTNTTLCSTPISVESTINKDKPINLTQETGLIKTNYSDEKRSIRSKRRNTKKKENKSFDDLSKKEFVSAEVDKKIYKRKLNTGINSLVRSDTKLDKTSIIATIKSRSCASINQRNYNILNEYIFGGTPAGPFENQVYFVNYFTVENDFADSPKSPKSLSSPKTPSSPKSLSSPKTPSSPKTISSPKSPGSPKSPISTGSPKSQKSLSSPKSATLTEKIKSEKSITSSQKSKSEKSAITSPSEKSKSAKSDEAQEKVKYKFRICESECPFRRIKGPKLLGSQSVCSLDLPQKASHLISVKKCHDVKCIYEKMREVPTPPDDRIFLNLSSRLAAECCQKVTKKIEEEVITGMKAKMKFGSEPCYCECECQFRFMKKTTFCKICGGYERFGEDYGKEPGYDLPFPCPVFHKLADKSKLKISASGSDTKNKKQKDKPESEKESKKGKKRKDNRFKFNYGYTGIPPHIGHSRCALPCVGTLGAVPKRMGWLWTCENVPGMKVGRGWKPGAISHSLLKKLNKTKRQQQPEQRVKPKTKPIKQMVVDKPTLIICKKKGEYHVEMQANPENSDVNMNQCNPLVYRISREDNEERIQKRLRKRHNLVEEAVKKVWVDPYHPEICEKTCLRAYREAIGLSNPNNPDCTCSVEEEDECSCCDDEEDSSDCSSLDLEWEIHFSPPIASQG